jgi:hypothetical protein
MSHAAIPLVAAGLDWLEGLLPLLFVVIWIASQVLNLFRGAKRPEPRPQPAPPPRPVAGGDRPIHPDVEREIEEFLRDKLRGGPTRERPGDAAGSPKPQRRRVRRPDAAEPPPLPAEARPLVQRSPAAGSDIASHVATAFAHDLAHQSPSGTTPNASGPVASAEADELVAALRAPGGLRRFLLMQEVLTRPTHRW